MSRIPRSFMAGALIVGWLGGGCTGCEALMVIGREPGPDLPASEDAGPPGLEVADAGDSSACNRAEDCAQGECFGGVCCSSEAQVCAGVCCEAGSACLAGVCVGVGPACRTLGDCAEGEYCEPAFGEPSPPAAPGCGAPLAPPGRCVAVPQPCADGQGDGCEALCEYRPKVQLLDAAVRWHWEGAHLPSHSDVWSTPTVGRLVDVNCDGVVDAEDPPSVVFVSGDSELVPCSSGSTLPSRCQKGVLRVLNGRTGEELWSLERAEPGSVGFAGLSTALADLDGDGRMEIVAATGEGKLAVIDAGGAVKWLSAESIPGAGTTGFGWGGGLSIADMDGDGFPEVAYGRVVFTTRGGNGIRLLFAGTKGAGGPVSRALSTFAELDGDVAGGMELLAGRTAYRADGTVLWHQALAGDGYSVAADFDLDGEPEVVLVEGGRVWLLEGATGAPRMPALTLPGTGAGGPPTVADFDADGRPEIGIAQKDFYYSVRPNFAQGELEIFWQTPNHDFSSSVTGSTVFDFEGDGSAEVVYADECFLWVFDGKTGGIRFATPTSSFTGTEAPVVADVDGDGRAEIVLVSNMVDKRCNTAPWNEPDPISGRPAWTPPPNKPLHRGVTVFGDRANAWVGTRALWNQHGYHVTNICDDRDGACTPKQPYGAIPVQQTPNWKTGWLNNFRQNVLERGQFNAPDATVSVTVRCTEPLEVTVSVRNLGQAVLPAGVPVVLHREMGGSAQELWRGSSTRALYPGQTERLELTFEAAQATRADVLVAEIWVDPVAPTFRECREDNNRSAPARAACIN
jgi:hypothetical protein